MFLWAGVRLRRTRKTGSTRTGPTPTFAHARERCLREGRGEVLRPHPAREKCQERERVPGGLFGGYIGPWAPSPGGYCGSCCLGPPWVPVALRLRDLPGPCGPRVFRLACAAGGDRAWMVWRHAESAPAVESCLAP
ncbi:hypothetical protein NDU88_003562 [Pleurodeles waltl]|uniref:Uncharacterized protein n=1 Tax=Pleurodeles waltl TaxID=8319 RepID=A0AAV7M3Q2_PLEWA|nr:hypothetical protein NDU88_003562 [Pleurodeles waltl]